MTRKVQSSNPTPATGVRLRFRRSFLDQRNNRSWYCLERAIGGEDRALAKILPQSVKSSPPTIDNEIVTNFAWVSRLTMKPSAVVSAMGVLILGGSRAALNGDFTADNIATVGEHLLSGWSLKRDPKERLADCLKAAPVNPWTEE